MILIGHLSIGTMYNVSRAYHTNDYIIKKNKMIVWDDENDKPYMTYRAFYSNFQNLYDLPVNNIHEVSIHMAIKYTNESSETIEKLDRMLSTYKYNEYISYTFKNVQNKDPSKIDPDISKRIYNISIILYNKTNPTKNNIKNVRTYKKFLENLKFITSSYKYRITVISPTSH